MNSQIYGLVIMVVTKRKEEEKTVIKCNCVKLYLLHTIFLCEICRGCKNCQKELQNILNQLWNNTVLLETTLHDLKIS